MFCSNKCFLPWWSSVILIFILSDHNFYMFQIMFYCAYYQFLLSSKFTLQYIQSDSKLNPFMHFCLFFFFFWINRSLGLKGRSFGQLVSYKIEQQLNIKCLLEPNIIQFCSSYLPALELQLYYSEPPCLLSLKPHSSHNV